jgi:hypothetical protein
MAQVAATWVRAPTLEKLRTEHDTHLADFAPEDIVTMSHATEVRSSRQTGGIRGGARTTYDLEYTALVLVRTA